MHTRIEHETIPDNKYKANDLIFDSLHDVIEYYKATLQFPLNAKTSEWQVECTQLILSWKQERDRFTESIRHVVGALFDVNEKIELPVPTINNGSETDWTEIETRVSSLVENLFNVVE